MENHERHFPRTTILQVGAKQIEDNDRDKKSADDVILLVPVVQKVDKTLNTGSISIYWIALLISLYFSILYRLMEQRKCFFFSMDQ